MPNHKIKLIESLAKKKLLGTISEEEQHLLNEWLNRQPADTSGMDQEEEAKFKNQLLKKIKQDAGIEAARTVRHRIPSFHIKWVAAAAILVLIATGSHLYFTYNNTSEEKIVIQKNIDVPPPATNLATITLSDGQTIYLDKHTHGQMATQGKVKLIKDVSGQISYEIDMRDQENQLLYNKLNNPRGSKVTFLTLTDGTKVWLNAGSSLTYPVSFIANERKVAITGEAYFEVAPDKSKPFIVTRDQVQIKVLGTYFNINAYNDEPETKITLLEGAVQVSVIKPGTTIMSGSRNLLPGQQALLNNSFLATETGNIIVEQNADINEVMAWKNGEFRFKNKPIDYLLRQAARWYNIEFSYTSDISGISLSGVITRQENISKLLEIIAATNQVQFTVEGKVIKVSPYKKNK